MLKRLKKVIWEQNKTSTALFYGAVSALFDYSAWWADLQSASHSAQTLLRRAKTELASLIWAGLLLTFGLPDSVDSFNWPVIMMIIGSLHSCSKTRAKCIFIYKTVIGLLRKSLFVMNGKPPIVWLSSWTIHIYLIFASLKLKQCWDVVYYHTVLWAMPLLPMSWHASGIIPCYISCNLPFVTTSSLHVSSLSQNKQPLQDDACQEIFCWIQLPVISSYITATDLLKFYRVNTINLLSLYLTWSSFPSEKAVHATLVPGRHSRILVLKSPIVSYWNWVNVRPCVEKKYFSYITVICLPLSPNNGRRDFIRCLHPSSFPSRSLLLSLLLIYTTPLQPTHRCPPWFERATFSCPPLADWKTKNPWWWKWVCSLDGWTEWPFVQSLNHKFQKIMETNHHSSQLK